MIALFGRLKKKMVLGQKGRFDPLCKSTPKGHTHHRNTFLDALGENPRFSGYAVDALKEPKNRNKNKKAREGTTSPICPPHPPFSGATKFRLWGRTVDVITYVRFQVNRFRGFGAPHGQK